MFPRPAWEALSEFDVCLSALETWSNTLPPEVLFNPSNIQKHHSTSQLSTFLSLHIWARQVVSDLTHIAMPGPPCRPPVPPKMSPHSNFIAQASLNFPLQTPWPAHPQSGSRRRGSGVPRWRRRSAACSSPSWPRSPLLSLPTPASPFVLSSRRGFKSSGSSWRRVTSGLAAGAPRSRALMRR